MLLHKPIVFPDWHAGGLAIKGRSYLILAYPSTLPLFGAVLEQRPGPVFGLGRVPRECSAKSFTHREAPSSALESGASGDAPSSTLE
jgi:hypothetical protein